MRIGMTGIASASFATSEPPPPPPTPQPLYWRFLRLRHVRPNGWQRAVLVEGVVAVAVTLVLADLASAWTLLVLPLATAVVGKGHDVLTAWLPTRQPLPPLPPAGWNDYLPL